MRGDARVRCANSFKTQEKTSLVNKKALRIAHLTRKGSEDAATRRE